MITYVFVIKIKQQNNELRCTYNVINAEKIKFGFTKYLDNSYYLEGHLVLCNTNMVSFLFMNKPHLLNSNSRRLLGILKILVPGWFVTEVSEAQTDCVV